MNSEVDPGAVRAALQRLLESDTLAGAEQLRNLIEYLVRNTLDGRRAQLNEVAVAENVLGRRKNFVALADSSARKAMSRLRAKLRDYYACEGFSAEVRFSLREYHVRFERVRTRVLVLPLHPANFRDRSFLAAELTEDLTLLLAREGKFELVPGSMARSLGDTLA